MATRRIKEITNTATTFASDDFIALDGTSQGTRKMDKDDLISQVSAGVSGDYLEEANNLSDVASVDTSKLNLEVPDVGTAPNEVPMSGQLGTMAFQDSAGVSVGQLSADGKTTLTNDQDNALVVETTNKNPMYVNVVGSAPNYLFDVRDDDTSKLRVDGSGRVGIGTSSPGSVADGGADELVIGDATGASVGMTVASGTSGKGRINFSKGSGTDAYRGQLSYNQANDSLSIVTAGSTRVVIDSSGRLGVGSTSPGSYNSKADNLVVGAESGDNGITILTGTGNDGSLYFADSTGGNNRGIVAYNHVADNLQLGAGGGIRAKIWDGGDLEVLQGSLKIGTSGKGIDFSSGSTLDAYEEGLYTATLTPSTSGTITVDSGTNTLAYVKVGNLVTVTGKLAVSAVSSPVGSYVQLNLPFAVGGSNQHRTAGTVLISAAASNLNTYGAFVANGGSIAYICSTDATSLSSGTTAADFSGNEELHINISYIAA
jgi:hypothetical protein